MNPIEYIDKAREKVKNHRDKSIMLLRKSDYYIYVEDRGKGGFYEELLENIYGKKFKIFDEFNGKKSLLNHYFILQNNNELSDNKLFLLDQDYEFIFETRNFKSLNYKSFFEIKNLKNIRILERTNIENYLLSIEDDLLSYENFVSSIRKATSKKEAEIKKILTYESYKKIICRMCNLSYIYMLNQSFDGTFIKEKKYICYDSFCYTDEYYHNLNKLKDHFNNIKSEFNELLNGVEDMSFEELFKEFKINFISEVHIDMKQVLYQLISYIRITSTKSGFEKMDKINEDVVKMSLLLNQKEELKEEIKEILRI